MPTVLPFSVRIPKKATPIGARGMTPVKSLIFPPNTGKLIDADQPTQLNRSPGQRKHQCEGVLGA